MNEQKQEKIKRFLEDKVMSDAVYHVLLHAFLEAFPAGTDVQVLAASRLSLQMLDTAWKRLSQSVPESKKDAPPGNVAV